MVLEIDARVKAGKGLPSADATGPGAHVPPNGRVERCRGHIRRHREVGAEQAGAEDHLDIFFFPPGAIGSTSRQHLEASDVILHAEEGGGRFAASLPHLVTQALRSSPGRVSCRPSQPCQGTWQRSDLPRPLALQKVGDPGGPVETEHGFSMRECINRDIRQRIQPRRHQEEIGFFVGSLNGRCLTREADILLEPGPLNLIDKVNGVMHVAIGIVAMSEPDETAIAPLLERTPLERRPR